MTPSSFAFSAPLWRWPGHAAWHFVTLPVSVGVPLRAHAPQVGFRSIRVRVTVGDTTWKTSVFPDKTSGSYILPVKAEVRKKEGLVEGDEVVVFLEV